MAKKQESGFTLVEVVIVLAIGTLLALIVFAGQRQLRSQASFDAAVEKIVSSIATAHSEASTGLNDAGDGTGSAICGGSGPAANSLYLFAGTSWQAKDDPAGATFQIDSYAVSANKITLKRDNKQPCLLSSKVYNFPEVLRVGIPGPPNQYWRIGFLRDDKGGVIVCNHRSNGINTSASVTNSYKAGDCVPPTFRGGITIKVSDTEGHSSDIEIDDSGLPRRLN